MFVCGSLHTYAQQAGHKHVIYIYRRIQYIYVCPLHVLRCYLNS